ncbi:cupin domain-containing protein [Candidatus Formimonas warabiya]|uniref:Cupin type-2 domain-containing protein n=1 Tax=Formimonas warabiya TaxID=1761012 RepID=A0A3G1KQL7_FORW1|nr:cupin domain-containing protein [Candidatus Formimonas warabiya]ATW24740.1 hypothetical protein DCMF_08095 [Candidatus Formimonas warabiya]
MTETSDIQHQEVNQKVHRIIGCGESLMLVESCFKKGATSEPHRHEEHEQAAYMVQGSIQLLLGNENRVLKPGDGYCAPKNMIHGFVVLEDAVVISAFTPLRTDLLNN